MRRPFLRRLIQAIVILILIFYAFQKRETLAQIAWVFAAASVLTLVLSPACTLLERKGFALRRPPPSAYRGLFCWLLWRFPPLFRTSSRARQT